VSNARRRALANAEIYRQRERERLAHLIDPKTGFIDWAALAADETTEAERRAERLRVHPELRIPCRTCGAQPEHDCDRETTAPGYFHLARIDDSQTRRTP
jgi:hypothetical protein